MSDAFQCDRCEEYRGGDGHQVRYGEYHGVNRFTGKDKIDFEYTAELCQKCKDELDLLMEDFAWSEDNE